MADDRGCGFIGSDWIWIIIIILIVCLCCPGIFGGLGFGFRE